MEYKINDNELTIFLQGKIDSTNAKEVEDNIVSITEASEFDMLTFDAEKLDYISSAGLRVILRMRKSYSEVKIKNVSSEVYDIFEMTGFTEIINIEKAFRKLSVDGCKIIGKGAKGTVYRYDDETIVKVYNNPDSLPDIKKERELARKAFVLGIPTAISYDIVKVGDSYGSVFELLDAKSYSAVISEDTENIDVYVKEITNLLKKIHSSFLPENEIGAIKGTVFQWLNTAKPELENEQYEKLYSMIDELPDTLNVVHCDYHTNNIMYQNGETLLIDMDTLSQGHPVIELANVYITFVGFGEINPTIVENFLSFPYSVACEIWKKFLPLYLETDDADRVTEVENKVRLLSYLRFMRHIIKRGQEKQEEGRKTVDYCKQKIAQLIKEVDTLDF